LHGTSALYLDNTAQTPTWRQFTPFGAPRGTPVTWIDPHGFLNKPADPATGLTDVGAREYDPVTGQFISPDPVLDPASPQDLDPYAYGLDNPVSNSDPTGLRVPTDPGGCQSYIPGCPGYKGPGGPTSGSGGYPGPHGYPGIPQQTTSSTGNDAGSSPMARLLAGVAHQADILAYYNAWLVKYASDYGPRGASVTCPSWMPGCGAITDLGNAIGSRVQMWLQRWNSGWSNQILYSIQEGKIFVTTPRGVTYKIPDNWVSRKADTGKRIVFQDPNSVGVGNCNQNMIKVMEPTDRYPNGYARIYNCKKK
jgi:RHS repeat-associated protein